MTYLGEKLGANPREGIEARDDVVCGFKSCSRSLNKGVRYEYIGSKDSKN